MNTDRDRIMKALAEHHAAVTEVINHLTWWCTHHGIDASEDHQIGILTRDADRTRHAYDRAATTPDGWTTEQIINHITGKDTTP